MIMSGIEREIEKKREAREREKKREMEEER